jgi:hypothetical protein
MPSFSNLKGMFWHGAQKSQFEIASDKRISQHLSLIGLQVTGLRSINVEARSALRGRGANRIRRIDIGGHLEFAPVQHSGDSNSVRFRPDDH